MSFEGEEGVEIESVYRTHFPALIRLAYLLAGSSGEAEDIVHDAFIRCVAYLPGVEHQRAYLRTAVINEFRRQHRRRRRAKASVEPLAPVLFSVEVIELRDALRKLDDRRRMVLVLRYFCDLPYEEIADLLNCAPATVRSIVHRTINELREVLR